MSSDLTAAETVAVSLTINGQPVRGLVPACRLTSRLHPGGMWPNRDTYRLRTRRVRCL